uniref:THUMP domain-containing protein n=1 Tax=Fervidicoccus fontis TaxID=683846 RepID=A0A7J3ZK96_9CREN
MEENAVLFTIKTVPGLEDLLLLECELVAGECQLLDRRPGRILVSTEASRIARLLETTRLATSAYAVLARFHLDTTGPSGIDRIYEIALGVEWERHIANGETFAVRSERVGRHDFTSIDVSRAVGQAVLDRLGEAGRTARVHLTLPRRIVVAEVLERELLLGLSLTGDESLHRRWYRVREHTASLKPPIAFAMIVLSGMRDGELLLDPMCGGGTIPVEALLYLESSRALCNDKSSKSVEMAMENSMTAGVACRMEFLNLDVQELPGVLGEESVDRIITNPPYGIRMGTPRAALGAVRRLLRASRLLLKKRGTLVLITPDRERVFSEALSQGFAPYCEKWVMHGDLEAWILCFSKTMPGAL